MNDEYWSILIIIKNVNKENIPFTVEIYSFIEELFDQLKQRTRGWMHALEVNNQTHL